MVRIAIFENETEKTFLLQPKLLIWRKERGQG